jgi:hypothetical protein
VTAPAGYGVPPNPPYGTRHRGINAINGTNGTNGT